MTNTLKTPIHKELILVDLPDDANDIKYEQERILKIHFISYMNECDKNNDIIIDVDKSCKLKIICQLRDLTDKQCEEWGYKLYVIPLGFFCWNYVKNQYKLNMTQKESFESDLISKGIQYNENTLIIEKI